MGDNKLKVKYKIRHIIDYEPIQLENARNQYIMSAERPSDVERIIQNEMNEGWKLHVKRPITNWGFELFFIPKDL